MSGEAITPAERLTAVLDGLAGIDVVALGDSELREQVLGLLTLSNRVYAELARRLDVFDRRELATSDGFRTTRTWLIAFGRLSAGLAGRLVRATRLLRSLPKLATAAQAGDVTAEHVQQVGRLTDRVGVAQVEPVDAVLADAARALDPARFESVCQRVAAHLDPDGGADPAEAYGKRGVTLSSSAGMMMLRGQLDPEGGAVLATALDALMTPPAETDERTGPQRRADAMVDLARLALSGDRLPNVGGQRPQIGVLLFPQALSPMTLAKLAELHKDEAAGQRLRELAEQSDCGATGDWTRPDLIIDQVGQAAAGLGRTTEALRGHPGATNGSAVGRRTAKGNATNGNATNGNGAGRYAVDATNRNGTNRNATNRNATNRNATNGNITRRVAIGGASFCEHVPGRQTTEVVREMWSSPRCTDPPWLSWMGPVSPVVAQRIACDADIWRIILDPNTGMPLDVGRGYRLVPHWMRKALVARDRGCRWPSCHAPPEWCDGHHLKPWAEQGETTVDGCLLLCRHHHSLVHEGGWQIRMHADTGEVTITRPGGFRYELKGSHSWNGPTSQTGWTA